MKGFIAFSRKEILEYIRTYKALILVLVLALFGMISSLLAKLLPEILKNMPMDGVIITIPEPTFVNAYEQFFKNITQMGFIVVILIFSGTIAVEITKGTLINVLSKGLSRKTVILSKYFMALSLWTIAFVIASFINYGYTVYLFGSFTAPNLFLAHFCIWLFVAFIIAIIILMSTLVSGNYGGLLLTLLVYVILLILAAIPSLQKYNPITLMSVNLNLIIDKASISYIIPAILITIGLSVIAIIGSLLVFDKKQL